jgi:hypothetical protein
VPSAEALARFSPVVAAYWIGLAHRDPALGLLASETYKAFARRRSLLLLDLQSRARINELPWVSAIPRDQLRSG